MIGPLAGLPVDQLGFIFPDLEPAIAAFGGEWERRTGGRRGVGPMTEVLYRGQPAELDHFLAMSVGREIEIELIQPGGGANVWQEWLDTHGPGLQHVRVQVPSVNQAVADMEAAGYPLLQAGYRGDEAAYAYFDTVAAVGVVVETLQARPA